MKRRKLYRPLGMPVDAGTRGMAGAWPSLHPPLATPGCGTEPGRRACGGQCWPERRGKLLHLAANRWEGGLTFR